MAAFPVGHLSAQTLGSSPAAGVTLMEWGRDLPSHMGSGFSWELEASEPVVRRPGGRERKVESGLRRRNELGLAEICLAPGPLGFYTWTCTTIPCSAEALVSAGLRGAWTRSLRPSSWALSVLCQGPGGPVSLLQSTPLPSSLITQYISCGN